MSGSLTYRAIVVAVGVLLFFALAAAVRTQVQSAVKAPVTVDQPVNEGRGGRVVFR